MATSYNGNVAFQKKRKIRPTTPLIMAPAIALVFGGLELELEGDGGAGLEEVYRVELVELYWAELVEVALFVV
jgi:hypothetical protein